MVNDAFVQLSIIFLVVIGVSAVLRLFKQPLIIGYIFAGILVGQYFLNIAPAQQHLLESFASIGIAILLFIVGLSLDPKSIKSVGKVSLLAGLGQVVFTSVIGYAILIALGFSPLASLYVAIALTFSSTIIITKLLSDKGDIDALYGRIAIGFLIVQDVVAVVILMLISSFIGTGGAPLQIAIALGIGFVAMAVIFVIGVYVLPPLTKRIARSQEFLLLFALGWCFVIAALFSSLKFSLEVGALIAGFTLSFTPYRYEIGSRLKPLRDFFIIMFFILLGSQMVFTSVVQYIPEIVILSLFILIGNPLIVLFIMGRLGYSGRVGFKAGLTVAQISEFSLILVALGARVGHVSSEILSVVTIIGLITFAGSTYLISYSERLIPLLRPVLRFFEKKKRLRDRDLSEYGEASIILLGHDRIGFSLMRSFRKLHDKYLVVDFNPDIIAELRSKKIPCVYGDITDVDLLDEIKITKAKIIISTVPYLHTSLFLLERLRKSARKSVMIMTANNVHDALRLYEAGADYVLLPQVVSGYHAASLVKKYKHDKKLYRKAKDSQIDALHDHIERDRKLGKSGKFRPRFFLK